MQHALNNRPSPCAIPPACVRRKRAAIVRPMPIGEDTPSKLQRIRELLREHKLAGAWLRHHANVSWACDGARAHIHVACDVGVMSLFVTPDAAFAITNDIEHARLRDEEGMQHWQFISTPWAAPAWTPHDHLPASAAWGCDTPMPHIRGCIDIDAALLRLRVPLLAGEQARLRSLGADVSAALFAAVQTLTPHRSEHAIAAVAAHSIVAVGAEPVVVMVAGDDRIARVRHPLPTSKPVAHVAMLVICARRHGLVVSMTRFVGFGPAQERIEADLARVAYVDACAIAQTRPGNTLASVWTALQAAYTHIGHPQAWQGLHQGGPCSYAPRDALLVPDAQGEVQAMQAFAWNPSIPGAKSEDTLLCTPQACELVTLGPWPTQAITVQAATYARPALLRLG